MSDYPWFRLYNETLNDPKLKRIATVTKQPKALINGVWAGLLCLASESPDRGKLLIANDMPYMLEEIIDAVGVDFEIGELIIDYLIRLELVALDNDIYSIVKWDDRQPKSDSSTERVRRYRAKKAAEAAKNDDFPEGNGNGYYPKRDGNVSRNVTETDSNVIESDKELESDNKDSQNAHAHESDPDKDRLNALADSLAAVCEVDLGTASQGLRKKTQRAVISLDGFGATPELVTGFSGWWWGDNSPQPWQVVDYWKKYLNKDKQNGQKSTRASERTIVKPERTAGNNPYFTPGPDKRVKPTGLPIAPELLAKLEQQSGTISQ